MVEARESRTPGAGGSKPWRREPAAPENERAPRLAKGARRFSSGGLGVRGLGVRVLGILHHPTSEGAPADAEFGGCDFERNECVRAGRWRRRRRGSPAERVTDQIRLVTLESGTPDVISTAEDDHLRERG